MHLRTYVPTRALPPNWYHQFVEGRAYGVAKNEKRLFQSAKTNFGFGFVLYHLRPTKNCSQNVARQFCRSNVKNYLGEAARKWLHVHVYIDTHMYTSLRVYPLHMRGFDRM